jgi:hypothetical protein
LATGRRRTNVIAARIGSVGALVALWDIHDDYILSVVLQDFLHNSDGWLTSAESNFVNLCANSVRLLHTGNGPVLGHSNNQLSAIGIGEAHQVLGKILVRSELLLKIGVEVLPPCYTFSKLEYSH